MPPAGRAYCITSKDFEPSEFFERWSSKLLPGQAVNFRNSIITAFSLPDTDSYVYHAVASVTLAHVQQAIDAGGQHGLHAWYPDANTPPPLSDIDAYASIFHSTTSTTKALRAFSSNAKKDTIRSRVAANLLSKRVFPTTINISRLKTAPPNPYLDYWTWSCHNLEWCGPEAATENVKQSHHILPPFYHHFGCVCPTHEALETMKQLAKGRSVIEAGSGNGYWTFMLRRMGMQVTAIDNGDSVWRTMWIGDTVRTDAGRYIDKRKNGAGDEVLLMVYPQVTTGFTKDVVNAYKGDTICVAGTQNANAFTADVGSLLELSQEWEKIVQTPLPSFAGKDEAFYVWKKHAQ